MTNDQAKKDINTLLDYNWDKGGEDFCKYLEENGDDFGLTYDQVDKMICDFTIGKNIMPVITVAAKSQHVFGTMARIRLWLDNQTDKEIKEHNHETSKM